jgi:hypothetical protein
MYVTMLFPVLQCLIALKLCSSARGYCVGGRTRVVHSMYVKMLSPYV